MINVSDEPIINKLIAIGISVKRVIKDSKKPAVIKSGIKPIIIFTPSFAEIKNDCLLE